MHFPNPCRLVACILQSLHENVLIEIEIGVLIILKTVEVAVFAT